MIHFTSHMHVLITLFDYNLLCHAGSVP